MAQTLFHGENVNLLTLKKLITHDGNFDDFFDSTSTDANFTTNTAAGTGGTFSQVINSLILTSSGAAQTQRIKYQNDLAYTISRQGSWPTYINFVLETRLKISAVTTMAGFSITHSDLDFTTATNIFWVGLYYTSSGAGNSGLKIVDPSGTTTTYTTQAISLDTEYNLVVEVYYNVEVDTDNTLIHVHAWLDGTKIIDDFTIDRVELNNYILDGSVGLVGDIPLATGRTITWLYWCCNRLNKIDSVEFTKSMLYKIGELSARVYNSNNSVLKTITDQSPITIYARNDTVLKSFLDYKQLTVNPFVNPNFNLETNLEMKIEFDGNSIDSSGNSRHGTPIGSLQYTKLGNRYVAEITNSNQYFTIPTIANGTFTDGFTFSFWIKFTEDLSNVYIFRFRSSTQYVPFSWYEGDIYVIMYTNTTGLFLHANSNGSVRVEINFTIPYVKDRWTHIVITHERTGSSYYPYIIYTNGKSIAHYPAYSLLSDRERDVNTINYPSSNWVGQIKDFYVWSRFLTFDEVQNLYQAGVTKYNLLANDIVFKFSFNGNASDETGTFDGTLIGTAAVTYDYHGYRKVLTLDGNSDYVDLPDIDIEWSRGFTFSFWCIFDLASHADYEVVYTATSTAGSVPYRIIIYRNTSTNNLLFVATNATGTNLGTITATNAITQGVPLHVIITCDTLGNVVIYINNTSSGTGTLSALPPTYQRTAHYIGWERVTYYMDGEIWDFCLWNRLLTSTERQQIYENNWFQQEWHGFNRSSFAGSDDPKQKMVNNNQFNIGIIQAYHNSGLLDNRPVIQSYTSQISSYIITNATYGIIPLVASDLVTTNNVATGVYTLTKNYYQNSVREILLELASEEDYLVWLDEDDDLHFISIISIDDSGIHYTNYDNSLIDYNFEYLSSNSYTSVEVHGYGSTETGVHLIYKNPLSVQMTGGERTKVIVDPRITTNAEALRRAREFFVNDEGWLIGEIIIPSDFTLDIGNVINITVVDDKYSIKYKKFLILEIKELFFEDRMVLTLSEFNRNISDILYEQFLQSKKQEQIFLDTAAAVTKTYALQLDIVIGVKHTYLVEISGNGTNWITYASGKAVTTNRAIAILTACIGNEAYGTTPKDGKFSSGLVFKIGTGTDLPLTTNTDLNNPITGEEQTVLPSAITQTTGNGYSIAKATSTWDNASANGYSVSEFGYYANREDPSTGGQTVNKYATISKWSPYNIATQLHARCVIPPFSKTSSNYIRCTFTAYIEISPQLKGGV
jgi:hypothetical protein